MSTTASATTLASDAVKQDGGVLTHRVNTQTGTSPASPDTSSLTIPDFLTGKSSHEPIPYARQLYYIIRAIYVFFIAECPLFWAWLLQGRRNERADVEGPFYIAGAPNTQIADGKAIIASREDMESNPPYLLTIHILSPSGKPLPYAKFDFWQATTAGTYYNNKYRLRGVFNTDAEGKCEILAVIPGAYGFKTSKEDEGEGWLRAGHFHIRVSPPNDTEGKNLETLTTQIYVCRKNDPKDMGFDFVNLMRAARVANMVHSWSTSSFYPSLTSPAYSAAATKYSFSPVAPTSINALKSIDWWNTVLADRFPGGEPLRVMAGGETTMSLNKTPRFLWF